MSAIPSLAASPFGEDPQVFQAQLIALEKQKRLACEGGDSKTRRKYRNALLRRSELKRRASPDVRKQIETNPNAHGAPRGYSIEFLSIDGTVDAPPPYSSTDDGSVTGPPSRPANIVLGNFGTNSSALMVNGHCVAKEDMTFVPELMTLSFQTFDELAGEQVAGYIDFSTPQPLGNVAFDGDTFQVKLKDTKVAYNVKVSANAGAKINPDDLTLLWDADSAEWQSASWEEDALTFAYGTVEDENPWQPLTYIENYFTDSSSPTIPMSLTIDNAFIGYKSLVEDDVAHEASTLLKTECLDDTLIPEISEIRKGKAVKSVFPKSINLRFSPWGDSFTGAYQTSDGSVYAASGTVIHPGFARPPPGSGQGDVFMQRAPVQPLVEPPVEAVMEATSETTADPYVQPPVTSTSESILEIESVDPMTADSKLESDAYLDGLEISNGLTDAGEVAGELVVSDMSFSVMSQPTAMSSTAAYPSAVPISLLNIRELLGVNTMVEDKSTSGYKDIVGEMAMDDFYKIIIYHMEPELRKLFISATPPVLEPAIQAIAMDHTENEAFYRSLQVPFLVMQLGSSTLEPAKFCNTARAQKQLREIPANSETYRRHSQKLYKHRFLQKFPYVSKYLDDQLTDKSREIKGIFDDLKNDILKFSDTIKDSNPNIAADEAAALADLDQLKAWCISNKSYWALQLYYFLKRSTLPLYRMKFSGIGASKSLALQTRNINALFGILENNESSSSGVNFMRTWNDVLRDNTMTTLIPLMADIRGNFSEFDDLTKSCLYQLWEKYKDSPSPELLEAATYAWELYIKTETRRALLSQFRGWSAMSGVVAADAGFQAVNKLWEDKYSGSKWWSAGLKASTGFRVFATSCMMVLTFTTILGKGWAEMTTGEKVLYGGTVAGFAGAMLLTGFKVVMRTLNFWSQFEGFTGKMKLMFGGSKVLEEIPLTQGKFQRGWKQYFGAVDSQRKAAQEIIQKEIEAGIPQAPPTGKWEKFQASWFGRNGAKLFMTSVAVVMSIYTIVVAAIELSKTKSGEGLLRASLAISIASSVFSICAVIAGFVSSVATVGGTTYAIAQFISIWAGPLAIVFALIGVILYFIFSKTQEPPPSPFDVFLRDRVAPLKLYMKYRAIDYINTVPSQRKDAPSLRGVSFSPASIFGGTTSYLRMVGDTQSFSARRTVGVESTPDMNYQSDRVWMLETDSQGISMVTTLVADANGATMLYCLGVDGQAMIPKAYPYPLSTEKDIFSRIQWEIETLADPSTVSETDKAILSTVVSLRNVATNKYLENEVSKEVWALKMQPLAPSDFKYDLAFDGVWHIFVDEANLSIHPAFTLGAPEQGSVDWSISPSLDGDPTFELQDTGNIAMRKDAKVTEAMVGQKTYTVTCKLKGSSEVSNVRTCTFSIHVEKETEEVA